MGRIGVLNKSCHRQTMYYLLAHLFINFSSACKEFTQKLEITMTYKSYNDTDLWRSGPLVILQDGVLCAQGHCYCLSSGCRGCGVAAAAMLRLLIHFDAVRHLSLVLSFSGPSVLRMLLLILRFALFLRLAVAAVVVVMAIAFISGLRLQTEDKSVPEATRGSKAETSISSEFGVIPQQLSLTESKNNQKKHHSWTHFPNAPKLHFYLVSLPHACSFGKNAHHQLSKQH